MKPLHYERQILSAHEKGQLKSVATQAELAKFKAAARATAIRDGRVNNRLSSGDLSDERQNIGLDGASTFVTGLIDHHGQSGSSHTATRR